VTESASVAPAPADEGAQPPSVPPRRKLDLTRVAPPENLESVRVEELTIDGICGVY
jgi:mycofactocin precursor